jgi:hypothetical protein
MREKPRHPTPSPRTKPLVITDHAKNRLRDRNIPEQFVRETVRSGREVPLEEAGEQGGTKSKFEKQYKLKIGNVYVPKCIVAVCEELADKYLLATAYHRDP